MSRWKSLSFYELDSVPANPGVFALYNVSDLVHVGQSIDLLSRLRYLRCVVLGTRQTTSMDPHGLETCAMEDLRVKYKLANTVGEWLSTGYRLMSRLQPAFNKRSPSWKELLEATRVPVLAMRHMKLRDFCLQCRTKKERNYMLSKTWCKVCASHNPVAFKASKEKPLRRRNGFGRHWNKLHI